MKYTTLNPIATLGLLKLPEKYENTDNVNEADAILVRSTDMQDMEFSDTLKCIARAGTDVNNIPVEKLSEKGVVVFNTPGANANGVKELTLAALLLAARDIKGGLRWCDEHQDEENLGKTVDEIKMDFAGTELQGKTLGVIGLGAVGALVANAAFSLGMNVVGYDPFLSDKVRALLIDAIQVTDNLEGLYTVSDYVTVHVPQTAQTMHILNKAAFNDMKDGVVIINTARPGLVNEADLEEALKSGKVKKYVTDVPTNGTIKLPNVVAFPHLGACTEEAEDNCAVMAVKEVRDYLENGNINNSVNFPRVSLGKRKGTRITILFKNEENINGKLTAAVCGALSVCEIGVKTQGDYGYAIYEVGEGDTEKAIRAVEAISAVIRTRVIG